MAGNVPTTVGLFGASSLGRRCLEQLRGHAGAATPACFFDNDSGKWATVVDGLPVRKPSASALQDVDVIWLTTAYAEDVQRQLTHLGVTTRAVLTLAEVVGGASTGAKEDAARHASAPAGDTTPARPRVNIVLADEGWILERCGREIEGRLPAVRVSRAADSAADINYYMNYSAFRASNGRIDVGFFTHVEERAPEAARRFFDVARQMRACVTMSSRYAELLSAAGVRNVHVITPGVDLERFRPAVKIGVVGRTYPTGRKGEDLVRRVMNVAHLEWHFTGDGWPAPGRTLTDEEMPAFYRSMDYILVPAHYEGGPMPVLEALASGVEVIAPRVGFVDEYPHIEFEAGNADDLRRVLQELVATRLARRQAVESRTWDAWAAAHDRLFCDLAGARAARPAAPAIVRTPGEDSATKPLRVLFALHAPESVVPVGGPSVRLPRMQQALAAHGVAVDIAKEELPSPLGYDLVHVFNVWEPGAALRQLQHFRAFDVPLVFSPIFLSLEEGLWAQRAVLPLFRQGLSETAFAAAIERVRSTPRDVRLVSGLTLDASWETWHERVRAMTALADHLIVLSEHEMSALHAIGALGTSFSLVHNGVDPAWADGANPEAFATRFGVRDYVLSVGRIEPRKNQLLLARALRETNLDLVLVGHPAKPEYADLVREHGARVRMVGPLMHDDPMLRSAFAGARAFALPSWSEGAPLVALEAAALGVPLVLSDRSGEREYFGPLARYCDPLDPHAMQREVLEAAAEPLDGDLRQARRSLVGRALTWAHAARETARAYATVLRDRRSQPLPGGFRAPAPRRLEIGNSQDQQNGCEHVDVLTVLPNVHRGANPSHVLPFPTGTFDEVTARDCLEHVSWRTVRSWLTECGRVLKPGGKLEVWTQDLEYLCRRYLERKDDWRLDSRVADEARSALGGYDASAWALIKMFGTQDRPESFRAGAMDEEVLTRVLDLTGFVHARRLEPFNVLRLSAERTPTFRRARLEADGRPDRAPLGESAGQVPGLLWDGPAFNVGGYASLTRHIMRALVPAGLSVQLRSRDDDGTVREQCLASPAEGWLWARALRRRVSSGAYICCYTPADWKGESIFQSRRDEHRGMSTYVGLTMFETDRLPRGWREACDALDEIWVPSRFNKASFTRAGVPAGKLQVVPIGIDASRYDPETVTPLGIPGRRGFVFLSVFDWTERKGWDVLLRAYVEAFRATDDVTLVLRTARRGPGAPVKTLIDEFLGSLGDPANHPHVIVLDEPVPDDEMPRLYRAADAFVLPTRGEGWGLPIMEAMASGLPVIVTRWGAHLDFVNDDNALLVSTGAAVPVGAGSTQSPFYAADHLWADPSPEHLVAIMRQVVADPEPARRRGAIARETIRSTWTPSRTAAWIAERLRILAPDPTLYMDLGRRADETGRLDEAERLYARAASLRRGWMLPVYNRASVLKRTERYGLARELFEQVARDGDTHALRAGSHYHLGELAFAEGQVADASAAFEACLADQADHRRARGWIAFIRGHREEQAGRFDLARDAYAEALSMAGTWPLAAYGLASALEQLGSRAEAQRLFLDVARAADQACLRGDAHYQLGEMEAGAGRPIEAAGHFESCLLEVPDHRAARERLAALAIVSGGESLILAPSA